MHHDQIKEAIFTLIPEHDGKGISVEQFDALIEKQLEGVTKGTILIVLGRLHGEEKIDYIRQGEHVIAYQLAPGIKKHG